MELTPEERQKIYQEERARIDARQEILSSQSIHERAEATFGKDYNSIKKSFSVLLYVIAGVCALPILAILFISPVSTAPILLLLGAGCYFFFHKKNKGVRP